MGKPIRIAVLECDTPLTGTQERYKGGYGAVFKDLLYRGADASRLPRDQLDITAWDVVHKQEYPDMKNIDAILITGSRHNSFDNDPWNLKLVDFTASVLAQQRVRIVGICYGHQIVARALGAKLGRNDKGWELAVTQVPMTDLGKKLFGTDVLNIHQVHQDIVLAHPEGVQPLGHTEKCQVQGMYAPKRLITVQGHPEFTGEIVRELLETRREKGILTQEVFEDAISRVDLQHDGVKIAKAFLKFLTDDAE